MIYKLRRLNYYEKRKSVASPKENSVKFLNELDISNEIVDLKGAER